MAKSATKNKKKATRRQHQTKIVVAPEITVPDVTKPAPHLLSIWQLMQQTVRILWQHKLTLGLISGVYAVLNIILVQSFATSSEVDSLKQHVSQVLKGHPSQILSSTGSFAQLISTSGGGGSQTGSAYQFFLIIITSLATIWAFRQLLSDQTIRARDAYYRGMYPLIPFVLVFLLIGLDLLPMLGGVFVFGIVLSNNIAVHWYEQLAWGTGMLVLVLLSLYLLASSLMALYIVTLPDMNPMKAVRSARDLVRGRHWTVVRKIIVLPIVLAIGIYVVVAPLALIASPLATIGLFILSALAFAAIHGYMYLLYRELLRVHA